MARRYSSLAAWMRATHTSQAKLARRLDVAPATVSHWVNGRRTPGLDMALRLNQLTGVPLENFLPSPSDREPQEQPA